MEAGKGACYRNMVHGLSGPPPKRPSSSSMFAFVGHGQKLASTPFNSTWNLSRSIGGEALRDQTLLWGSFRAIFLVLFRLSWSFDWGKGCLGGFWIGVGLIRRGLQGLGSKYQPGANNRV